MEEKHEKSKDIGEEAIAYECLHKFEMLCEVHRQVFEQVEFGDLIYKIYPTFFLRGIVFNGTRYILDERGDVAVAPTLARHHPRGYMYFRLSMLIRMILKTNGWPIAPEWVAQITERCETDFEGQYLDFFPYVVRVFTQNEGKKSEYDRIFPKKRFETFEFEEIQADVDEVTRSKLDQIEDGETQFLDIVDDTGLEMYAMQGAPGPYVKYFMETVKSDGIEEICARSYERRVLVHQSIAVSFWMGGRRQRIMYHAYFPCEWWLSRTGGGFGFDPHVKYLGQSLSKIKYEERFRAIIMGWIWHRFKRRQRGVI